MTVLVMLVIPSPSTKAIIVPLGRATGHKSWCSVGVLIRQLEGGPAMQACQLSREGHIERSHGDEEAIRPLVNGATLAEPAGGELVTLGGSSQAPHVRDPVRVNLLLPDFTRRSHP